MLIGIMSDTHDNLPAIRKAVEFFNERNVDLVIHAGDYVAPFVARELKKLKAPLKGVFGNNDGERKGLYEALGIYDELIELEADDEDRRNARYERGFGQGPRPQQAL